jgi:hypothetical protein
VPAGISSGKDRREAALQDVAYLECVNKLNRSYAEWQLVAVVSTAVRGISREVLCVVWELEVKCWPEVLETSCSSIIALWSFWPMRAMKSSAFYHQVCLRLYLLIDDTHLL